MQEASLNIILKNFDSLFKNLDEFEMFINMPINIFKEIISSDNLTVNNETQITTLVLEYIKSRRNLNEVKQEIIKDNENEDNIAKNENQKIEIDKKENLNYNEKWRETIINTKDKFKKRPLSRRRRKKYYRINPLFIPSSQ